MPGRTAEVGRILVVDDNESNRDLLERRLVHEGHEVVSAASGAAALAILSKEKFDLILLDLLMPDMNGLEMLERLKADERLYGIPVIMISGLSETEAVIRCIEAGAEDYLPKPFNLVLLRARINACLERKRWREREREYLARLQAEKDRSEALLRNILPDPIVRRLNAGETTIADGFADVSILFADLVGFTPAAARMTPERLVGKLNRIFSGFDRWPLAARRREDQDDRRRLHGRRRPARATIRPRRGGRRISPSRMLDVLAEENAGDRATPFELRIGIHTGPVVAGIIGRHKFIYDVWGDTVNIASRMESQRPPGRIHISDTTQRALAGRFQVEPRGADRAQGTGEGGRVLPGRADCWRELKQARPEAARTAVAILLLLGHSSGANLRVQSRCHAAAIFRRSDRLTQAGGGFHEKTGLARISESAVAGARWRERGRSGRSRSGRGAAPGEAIALRHFYHRIR